MDIYELLEKRNPVEKEKETKSLVDQLIKRNEILSNEVKSLNKKINNKENVINTLLKRISNLEFENEKILTIIEEIKNDVESTSFYYPSMEGENFKQSILNIVKRVDK